MNRILMGTIASAILLIAGTAGAQQPDLGETGRFALSAERLFGYVHTSETISQGGVSTTQSADTFTLLTNPVGLISSGYAWPRIGFDAFIARNISLGGSVGYFNVSPSSGSLSGFVFAPRVGYTAHIGPRVSIWPRGGFTFEQATSSDNAGNSTKQSLFALTLEAPLAIWMGPRFAIMVGPTLDLGLTGSRSSGGLSIDDTFTDFGIQAGLFVLL